MRCAASRRSTSRYHRALRRLIGKAHRHFGTAILIDCHSMPSVGATRRRAAPPGCRARRPLRHELRAGSRRRSRARADRRWATASAATSPMRAASSPSITATRKPACMRCSSSSTARSIWMSARASATAHFERVADRSQRAGARLDGFAARRVSGPFQAAAE